MNHHSLDQCGQDPKTARRWLDAATRESSYAVRTLVRAPGFTSVVVVTLALGIGVNATLFSVADAVVFKPYPFVEQERLVIAGESATDARSEVSYLNFRDWQSQARVFDGLAAMGLSNWSMSLRAEDPMSIRVRAVSGSWFSVLGVHASRGRVVNERDDERGAPRVLVLGEGLWQRQFGGRPDVVGERVIIDGQPFTIVGIMPKSFAYPVGAEAWTALVPTLAAIGGRGLPDFLATRGAGVLHLVGRLKTGITVDAARPELDALLSELSRIDGDTRPVQARLTPILDDILGSTRAALLALVGAVALLLLVALANTSGLMLIRSSQRRTDVAVRLALGASRAAIARQFLWEAAIIAVLATTLAVVLSRLCLPLLLAYVPAMPRSDEAAVDIRAVSAAVAAGMMAMIGCGCLPLLRLWRDRPGLDLRRGIRSATSRRRGTRSALVAFEVASAVVLVVGASLLYRSVSRVGTVDLGFEPTGLLAVNITPPAGIAEDADAINRGQQDALDAISSLPGVLAAGAVGSRPLKGPIGLDSTWQFDRQSRQEADRNPWVNVETVSSGYFSAMQTPLRAGRLLEMRDISSAASVAVISESLARWAWPGEDAVGRRLRTAALDRDEIENWLTVVGVVADVRFRSIGRVSMDVYVPAAQSPFTAADIMVRVKPDAGEATPLLRARLKQLEPAGVITIDDMSDVVAAHQAPWRSGFALTAVFAGLTVFLSSLGIFALLAASVADGTREIGVRMTLGATPQGIVHDVLRSGATVVLAGVALGMIGAAAGAGSIRGLLFEVEPMDTVTFVTVPLGVAAVTLTACLGPAWRAARVDPAISLRAE
jgi:putative ABC transport system permease protein